MSAFDLDAARRWARSFLTKTLSRRPDDALPLARQDQVGGQALLLDTCVYVDQMHGRTPVLVERLIDARPTNHSTVAIQELMHTIGVLRPDDPRSASAIDEIERHLNAMPPHRVFAPDPDVLARAALLSGVLCRLQGYANGARIRALHDCVLFLQAQKLGLTLLTGNISDFDFLLQLLPTGRVLMYRPI